jgi:hypothetical protein
VEDRLPLFPARAQHRLEPYLYIGGVITEEVDTKGLGVEGLFLSTVVVKHAVVVIGHNVIAPDLLESPALPLEAFAVDLSADRLGLEHLHRVDFATHFYPVRMAEGARTERCLDLVAIDLVRHFFPF